MVTAKYLTEKLIVPMRERMKAEAREEGRAEANHEWVDWYRSKAEADDKGLPFDEPPPAPLNSREVNP